VTAALPPTSPPPTSPAPAPPAPAPTEHRLGPRLLMSGAAVIVLAAMSVASYLVAVLLLSLLVALLLAPLRSRLVDRGMKAGLALLICLAAYVGVLAATGLLIVIGLSGFVENLDTYTTALADSLDGTSLPPDLAAAMVQAVADFAEALISTVGSGLAVIAYSVIVVAYLLLEAPRAGERVLWASGGRADLLARARTAGENLREFIIARTVLGLAAAVLDTIVLLILGVPSALLWGVLAFLFSFVPTIGFMLALIPPTILAWAVSGPITALIVIVSFSIINVAIDYLIQPRYMGTSVNLSPLVVTLSFVFWTIVLGAAGALLAIPLTICAVALADAFSDSRPLARLLVDTVGVPD